MYNEGMNIYTEGKGMPVRELIGTQARANNMADGNEYLQVIYATCAISVYVNLSNHFTVESVGSVGYFHPHCDEGFLALVLQFECSGIANT